MEVSDINGLILEHLRYYGYSLAARIIESEFKTKAPKEQQRPSRLIEIATRGYDPSFKIQSRTHDGFANTPERGLNVPSLDGRLSEQTGYEETDIKSDVGYGRNMDDMDTKRTGLSVRSDPANTEKSLISQALNFNVPYNPTDTGKIEYYTGIRKKFGLNSGSTLSNIARLITNGSTNTTQYSSANIHENESLYSRGGPLNGTSKPERESNMTQPLKMYPLEQTFSEKNNADAEDDRKVRDPSQYINQEYQINTNEYLKPQIKVSNNRSISTPAPGRLGGEVSTNQVATRKLENYMKAMDLNVNANKPPSNLQKLHPLFNTQTSNSVIEDKTPTIEYQSHSQPQHEAFKTLNPYQPERDSPSTIKGPSREASRLAAVKNNRKNIANEIISSGTNNLPIIQKLGQNKMNPIMEESLSQKSSSRQRFEFVKPDRERPLPSKDQKPSFVRNNHLNKMPEKIAETMNEDSMPTAVQEENFGMQNTKNAPPSNKPKKTSMMSDYHNFLTNNNENIQSKKWPEFDPFSGGPQAAALNEGVTNQNRTSSQGSANEYNSNLTFRANSLVSQGIPQQQEMDYLKGLRELNEQKYFPNERGNEGPAVIKILKEKNNNQTEEPQYPLNSYDYETENKSRNQASHQTQPTLTQSTLNYLTNNTTFTEKEIRLFHNAFCSTLNSFNNEDSLNKESFHYFLKETKLISSPTFRDYLFKSGETISLIEDGLLGFKEAVLLLDQLNPEHPFAIMKLLFKLCEKNGKGVLAEIEKILNEFSKSPMNRISGILIDSLKYISKMNEGNPQTSMAFEDYMTQVQSFVGLKQFC